ncbi:MAG: acetolactate decarboxylase [Actinomycetia bacterium]|nr:acetolactate decarboxylase [Actinomycetes bacterium]
MDCSVELSPSLYNELARRATASGETVDHVARMALAEHLQLRHSTLFQVSTATALVEGVYEKAVTARYLMRHGDFGLGTFADLDGEMTVIDGHCYQTRSTGTREAPPDAPVPFAVVTTFHPEHEETLTRVQSFDDLRGQLNALQKPENHFSAVRIDGRFDHIHTRAVCKVRSGVGLVDATDSQVEFDYDDVEGTIVGFWTPTYAKTINVAGWHLHMLNANRDAGGHLLEVRGENLTLQMQHLAEFHMSLPETAAFLQADLTRDPTEALDKAER